MDICFPPLFQVNFMLVSQIDIISEFHIGLSNVYSK